MTFEAIIEECDVPPEVWRWVLENRLHPKAKAVHNLVEIVLSDPPALPLLRNAVKEAWGAYIVATTELPDGYSIIPDHILTAYRKHTALCEFRRLQLKNDKTISGELSILRGEIENYDDGYVRMVDVMVAKL